MTPRGQKILHGALLIGACVTLPIVPGDLWKPLTPEFPVLRIFALLTVTLGLPYFLLSATNPLLQAWFSRATGGRSPYRLYALSNVGSLLGLLSYPFVIEPLLGRTTQATLWSAGFAIYVILSFLCFRWNVAKGRIHADVHGSNGPGDHSAPLVDRTLWLLLPACASVLLLAGTNQICQDIVVVPFLWVLPLSLYLLSFVICFGNDRWYRRPLYANALFPAIGAICWILYQEEMIGAVYQIGGLSGALFICFMVLHGELARLKPEPRDLTLYYLMIAAGGALGGVFVTFAAPYLFDTYVELHLGLVACLVLLMVVFFFDNRSGLYRGGRRRVWIGLIIAVAGLTIALFVQSRRASTDAIHVSRNFYGILRLFEYSKNVPQAHRYVLQHNRITHGAQFVDPSRRGWATGYYGEKSGVGLGLKYFDRSAGRRIGVVGLGAGTLAAYGLPGDTLRFYEIDPAVKEMAETRFTYLRDSKADISIALGDARLSMEREPAQGFDLLVLDAFIGDAVPVHLLTREAFEIYLRHLKPDGVILVHVTNFHFELAPVLLRLAHHFQLRAALINNSAELNRNVYASGWVLLSRNAMFLNSPPIAAASLEYYRYKSSIRLWTDDYASLFQILK